MPQAEKRHATSSTLILRFCVKLEHTQVNFRNSLPSVPLGTQRKTHTPLRGGQMITCKSHDSETPGSLMSHDSRVHPYNLAVLVILLLLALTSLAISMMIYMVIAISTTRLSIIKSR